MPNQDLLLWQEYRKFGGVKDYNAWVVAGKPPTDNVTAKLPASTTSVPVNTSQTSTAGLAEYKEAKRQLDDEDFAKYIAYRSATPQIESHLSPLDWVSAGRPAYKEPVPVADQYAAYKASAGSTAMAKGQFEALPPEQQAKLVPASAGTPATPTVTASDVLGTNTTGTTDTTNNIARYPSIQPRRGYKWEYNSNTMQWVEVPDTSGKDENQAAIDKAWEYQQANTQNKQWEDQMAWQKQQAQDAADTEQRNYLAGLAAKPVSWLEYAMASKTIPAIQPWMLPQMPQEYAGKVAGEALPGWESGTMAQLPELTRPSTQYVSRLSPSALQQYYGYEQMRTGATPEDTQYRIRSTAPSEGSNWLRYSQ